MTADSKYCQGLKQNRSKVEFIPAPSQPVIPPFSFPVFLSPVLALLPHLYPIAHRVAPYLLYVLPCLMYFPLHPVYLPAQLHVATFPSHQLLLQFFQVAGEAEAHFGLNTLQLVKSLD